MIGIEDTGNRGFLAQDVLTTLDSSTAVELVRLSGIIRASILRGLLFGQDLHLPSSPLMGLDDPQKSKESCPKSPVRGTATTMKLTFMVNFGQLRETDREILK